jgi:hypothetical protein
LERKENKEGKEEKTKVRNRKRCVTEDERREESYSTGGLQVMYPVYSDMSFQDLPMKIGFSAPFANSGGTKLAPTMKAGSV